MSGPQPHSHKRPSDENETLEVHARMHANRGPILRHECHSTKAWQGMKYGIQTCKFQHWNVMQNSPETWTHGTRRTEWTRNTKLGICIGLQLYKACIIWTWNVKTDSRQPKNKHIYSFWWGQTMNTNGPKLACKNGPEREVMKQVTAAGPKCPRALQKSWRGAQNEALYSLQPSPKQCISKPKILCKIRPKKRLKHKEQEGDLKQQKTLDQTWIGGKNKAILSPDHSPKI